MQTTKFIAGIGCLLLALLFGLYGLGDSGLGFALCGVGFAVVGCLLIRKRASSISKKGRGLVALILFLLGGFTILIAIPDFVRAEYESAQNSCVNNLRQLQAAKEEWALETGRTNGTIVTANDITPYVQLDSKGNLPRCPEGGTYIFGRVGEDVRCFIGTSDWPNEHVLNETNDFDWWTNFKEAYAALLGLHHPRKF
jgi:hypothetical protein